MVDGRLSGKQARCMIEWREEVETWVESRERLVELNPKYYKKSNNKSIALSMR